MLYTVNVQVECDVDDAYAIRRHAQRLISPGLQNPAADPFTVEATKTTEHCLSVILGSTAVGNALRGVGATVDGLEIIGPYVQVDQVQAIRFDSD